MIIFPHFLLYLNFDKKIHVYQTQKTPIDHVSKHLEAHTKYNTLFFQLFSWRFEI